MRKKYMNVKRCLIENVEHKRVNQENLQRVIYDGVPDMPSEDIPNCILFKSDTSFTIAPNTKSWNGTLYYSTDGNTWSEYTADTVVSDVKKCYFRGTGNTAICTYTNDTPRTPFYNIVGTNISVSGNIECLLDYEIVENGEHPEMSEYCCYKMFRNCTSLLSAPELPATTLTNNCYNQMFYGCTSLVNAPSLPATTLADSCYYYMFVGCTSLVNAPELPATTLADSCYQSMFARCSSLTSAPELPATTLADNCYQSMFAICSSLTSAPELPAITLANYCYNNMFYGCTSLVNAPSLPATTLTNNCYNQMFYGCTSLVNAPSLPATTLADSCYYGMFVGCTSLKIKQDGGIIFFNYTSSMVLPTAVNSMFSDTSGTFTETPTSGHTYGYE